MADAPRFRNATRRRIHAEREHDAPQFCLITHGDATDDVAPEADEMAKRRKELAPATAEAFEHFSRQVFAEGALPEKAKQLFAVAVVHVTQCPYCMDGHTKQARRKGASPEEIMGAIWVVAEMRADGAYAHNVLALHAMGEKGAEHRSGE